MSTVLLQPGATGIDALSHPDFVAVKDAGHSFVVCYVQPDRTSRALLDAIWAAGLVIILNKEGSQTGWQGGYAKGRQYALEAIRDATDLGWTGETGIIFSLADSTVTDYPLADQAHLGAFQTMGDYDSGAYGDEKYLGHLSTLPWIPPSYTFWQWKNNGPTLPYADLRQTSGGVIGNIEVDYNIVKHPILAWSGYGQAERKQSRMFRHTNTGVVYEVYNGHKFHCTEGYFYRILRGTLYPDTTGLVISYVVLDDAELDNLPDAASPSGAPTHFNITLNGSANA